MAAGVFLALLFRVDDCRKGKVAVEVRACSSVDSGDAATLCRFVPRLVWGVAASGEASGLSRLAAVFLFRDPGGGGRAMVGADWPGGKLAAAAARLADDRVTLEDMRS